MSFTEKLEFSRSIEGTFIKGLGPELTPEVKARLRSEGLDLDRPLLPAYPAADFHRWIEVAACDVYPNDSPEEACRKVGFRTVAGLEDTVMGRAIAAGLKLIGPLRSLQRLDRLVRNNNNYMQATVTTLGAASARVELSDTFDVPAFYEGFFTAAVQLTGGKRPRVQLVDATPPRGVFHLEWEA